MLAPTDLFFNCIVILTHDNGSQNRSLVKEILDIYEQDWKQGFHGDMELGQVYIRIIKKIMMKKKTDDPIGQLQLVLLEFKSEKVFQEHKDVYTLLEDIIAKRDNTEASLGILEEATQRIRNAIIWHRSNKIVRRSFAKLNQVADMVDPVQQARELNSILSTAQEFEKLRSERTDQQPGGMEERITFLDRASMKQALKKRTTRTRTGVYRTGLQGLNKMLGKTGGLSQGESLVFGARSHHYKSGFLQSMAMWIPLYNEAPVVRDGLKPLILMVSLENEAYQNFTWIAKRAYYQLTGNVADNIPEDDLVEWVYEVFRSKGFCVDIVRYLPSDFGYEELVSLVLSYETMGYFVCVGIIDYMDCMKKGTDKTSSGAGNHLHVKELFNKTVNFFKSRGITLVTAHQLTRTATELANSGKTNVVKHFSEAHLANSIDVMREPDVVIFGEIEKNHQGIPFLTMKIQKHRYVDDTPEAHKYVAYPFTPHGIIDDVLAKNPGFTRDIYAYELDTMNQTISSDPTTTLGVF